MRSSRTFIPFTCTYRITPTFQLANLILTFDYARSFDQGTGRTCVDKLNDSSVTLLKNVPFHANDAFVQARLIQGNINNATALLPNACFQNLNRRTGVD